MMRTAIRKILDVVSGSSEDVPAAVGAVRELIAESDVAFVPKDCLPFMLEEALSGNPGAWVCLLHLCHHSEGYEELLAASTFSDRRVLFAIHGLGLQVDGGEAVMWDGDGLMRTPERVRAQFGNNALRWLEAWVYRPE